mmetsp:Transcript_4317/g.10536  ORF Transcript_4317/g.10536 Transcript_4317/m.10536 type:complete len:312 (-) Transcript_4317:126-1061(-)
MVIGQQELLTQHVFAHRFPWPADADFSNLSTRHHRVRTTTQFQSADAADGDAPSAAGENADAAAKNAEKGVENENGAAGEEGSQVGDSNGGSKGQGADQTTDAGEAKRTPAPGDAAATGSDGGNATRTEGASAAGQDKKAGRNNNKRSGTGTGAGGGRGAASSAELIASAKTTGVRSPGRAEAGKSAESGAEEGDPQAPAELPFRELATRNTRMWANRVEDEVKGSLSSIRSLLPDVEEGVQKLQKQEEAADEGQQAFAYEEENGFAAAEQLCSKLSKQANKLRRDIQKIVTMEEKNEAARTKKSDKPKIQ